MNNEKEVAIINFLENYLKKIDKDIDNTNEALETKPSALRELLNKYKDASILFGKREACAEITKEILKLLI